MFLDIDYAKSNNIINIFNGSFSFLLFHTLFLPRFCSPIWICRSKMSIVYFLRSGTIPSYRDH